LALFLHLNLQAAEATTGGKLNLTEFGNAIKKLLGSHVSERELEVLFMKVDTNCGGVVDWVRRFKTTLD